VLCFTDIWVEVSMYPEGPETSHLDTGFLGFHMLKRLFRSSDCYYMRLMQPFQCKLQLKPFHWSPQMNFEISTTLSLSEKQTSTALSTLAHET
jgi:hypothetical protein